MMTERRIEIVIKSIDLGFVHELLHSYFGWKKSPDYPIAFITHKTDFRLTDDPNWLDGDRYNFKVCEEPGDERFPPRELAKIIFLYTPTQWVIFVEGDDNDKWPNVEKLVGKIITKMQERGFELISVDPERISQLIIPNPVIELKPQRRPPGRPSHKDDIWAWEQVNVLGRPISKVKKEWEQRSGVIARSLVDPDRAFRLATDPSKRQKNTKTGK